MKPFVILKSPIKKQFVFLESPINQQNKEREVNLPELIKVNSESIVMSLIGHSFNPERENKSVFCKTMEEYAEVKSFIEKGSLENYQKTAEKEDIEDPFFLEVLSETYKHMIFKLDALFLNKVSEVTKKEPSMRLQVNLELDQPYLRSNIAEIIRKMKNYLFEKSKHEYKPFEFEKVVGICSNKFKQTWEKNLTIFNQKGKGKKFLRIDDIDFLVSDFLGRKTNDVKEKPCKGTKNVYELVENAKEQRNLSKVHLILLKVDKNGVCKSIPVFIGEKIRFWRNKHVEEAIRVKMIVGMKRLDLSQTNCISIAVSK